MLPTCHQWWISSALAAPFFSYGESGDAHLGRSAALGAAHRPELLPSAALKVQIIQFRLTFQNATSDTTAVCYVAKEDTCKQWRQW